MTDPFVVLRSELVGAAARAEVTSPRRRWDWLRGRSRPLSVVIAALVICGSATAAVLSLTSSSQPLEGKVPGTITAARPDGTYSVAGYRYRIVVTPSLAAGQAGWNTGIEYIGRGPQSGAGEGAGGSYATASNPIFGGTGAGFVSTGQAQRGDTVGDVITGPQVAAIRIGNRTIRTFTSTELPAGDRAAVFFLPAGSPQPTVGWRPGQPIHSYIRAPNGPHPGPDPNKWPKHPSVAILPLDASGRIIPTTFSYPDPPFAFFWQAPKAMTPSNEGPPYHGPTHPRADGICQLGQHGLPGLTPVWGHTILRIKPAANSLGELFVSCVDAEYYLNGWPLATGVLVDARRPGQALAALPGTKPVPGVAGTVDFASANLSARRVGNAWLVVRGGSGSRQRLRVLEALRISRLDVQS
jgi:hypothetical protein